jgi:phosphatidylserine/phosphatidylglycerophosphate/cardiolipin synthase-like enzyme
MLIRPNGLIKKIIFVPRDPATKILTELINAEDISIRGAQFQLTSQCIAEALCNAKKRGVSVQIITDKSALTSQHQKISLLIQEGILVYPYAKAYLMHHKFWLFEKNILDKPVIWTGSANTSFSGLECNAEAISIWSDTEDALLFKNEFDQLQENTLASQKSK